MSDLLFITGMVVKPAEPCDACGCRKFRLEHMHVTVSDHPRDEVQKTSWVCVRCGETFELDNKDHRRCATSVEATKARKVALRLCEDPT